jgi:hypothetical protein
MRSTQTSSFESLPSELFLSIAEYAGFDGRLCLSATNSNFRTLLLEGIFRTLKITSDEDEANEVLEVAKRVGDNVRVISFHGTAGPNLETDEDDQEQDDTDSSTSTEESGSQQQVLPPAATALLGGKHLPNATTLIVHFSFDFDNHDGSEGVWDSRDDLSDGSSMYVFTVPETTEDMVDESEAEFPWRRLMAQTWASASLNPKITSLVAHDLIPKAVSPWFSPQWARFLAQIETADIQLWGGDNGAGWEVGTLPGYMYFVAQLDTYFFDFMTNTKSLRLSCYEHAPLGSRYTDITDTMSLHDTCLPRLEQLRLEYVAICPELVEFFKPKADTLKHVALHECFASDEYGVIQLTWANFFAGLRRENPKWESFSITNNAAPALTFREWQASKHAQEEVEGQDTKDGDEEVDKHVSEGTEEDGGEGSAVWQVKNGETETVKSVRAELARDPTKRLFLYATLTDKYGDRWPDHEGTMEHFRAGKDMEEFEKLMGLMGRSSGA